MNYSEKITALAGFQGVTLSKIENSYGDIYFRIKSRGQETKHYETRTTYEFSNYENAHNYFMKYFIEPYKNKVDVPF
jgi:hypothetical protein